MRVGNTRRQGGPAFLNLDMDMDAVDKMSKASPVYGSRQDATLGNGSSDDGSDDAGSNVGSSPDVRKYRYTNAVLCMLVGLLTMMVVVMYFTPPSPCKFVGDDFISTSHRNKSTPNAAKTPQDYQELALERAIKLNQSGIMQTLMDLEEISTRYSGSRSVLNGFA